MHRRQLRLTTRNVSLSRVLNLMILALSEGKVATIDATLRSMERDLDDYAMMARLYERVLDRCKVMTAGRPS